MTPRSGGPAIRHLGLLALLVALASPGRAEPADEDGAARIVAAHAAGNEQAFAAIVRSVKSDPWLLVDELLSRGHPEVARASLEWFEAPDAEALAAYVRTHRPADDAGARRALAAAQARLRDRDYQGVLRALEGVVAPPRTILEGRISLLRYTALYRRGNLEDALTASDVGATQAATLGWLGLERFALVVLQQTARELGAFGVAVRAYERLATVYEALRDPLRAARIRADLGGLQAEAGDLRRSVDLLTTAYAAFAEADAAGNAARTAVNMSLLFTRRGEMGIAREWLDRAETHLEHVTDPRERVRYVILRATLRFEAGEYAAARADLEHVLESVPPVHPQERYSALAQLGHACLLAGDPEEALKSLEEALRLPRGLGQGVARESLLLHIGVAHRIAGESGDALEAFEAVIEGSAGNAHTCGQAWLEIGRVRTDANAHDGALEAFTRAAPLLEQAAAWDALADLEHERARVALAAGRTADAYAHAMRSLALLDRVVVGLSDEPMARARQRRAGVFEVGLRAARAAKDAADGVSLLERWRARALLDAMGGRTRLRGAGLPSKLAAREVEATAAVTLAHRRYRKAVRVGKRKGTREAADALRSAEERMRDVEAQILRTAKRVAALKYPDPLDGAGVRATLHPGEALVHYVRDAETLRAFVTETTGARWVDLGLASEAAADLAVLDNMAKLPAETVESALERLAARLIDRLVLPKTVAKVFVCPAGALCYAPWPALSGTHTLTCVPSGTVLAALRSAAPVRGKRILALGDPAYDETSTTGIPLYFRGHPLDRLEETAREVEAITGPGDVVLTRDGATEAALADELAKHDRWRSIHLACHGLIHPTSPMLSALALSPTPEDDGFLTVYELLGLSLPTDLLVASACESGHGEVVSGEGVLGLTRAFFVAGAERAIVSLWRVEDEATRELMTTFHERWREGRSPAIALREAQEHVRDVDGGKWRHPRFWAAWVLWGRAE